MTTTSCNIHKCCMKIWPLSSPGQTIATFQRNISQHCWVQHVAYVWPPCCDMLWHVGCCSNLKTVKFFMQNLWINVAWRCSRCSRFVQDCCTWACALNRFSTRNMSQHVATGWPNARNMSRPTMLRSVEFKNVAIVWPGLANAGPVILRCVA